jgi:DNA-binding transcriptional ArsR family regulator
MTATGDAGDDLEKQAIPVAPDDAFEAIANSRRRRVLLSLARSNGSVSAGDLAVEIVAIEDRVDPDVVSSEQRTRVYVTLIQSHLPTLDDLGAVTYNERSKQVASTSATEALAAHIREITTACYEPEENDGE